MPKESISKAFYAVRRGHASGIYKTWAECKAQVDGFTKPHFRKFSKYEEAQAFVKDGKIKQPSGETKYDRSSATASSSTAQKTTAAKVEEADEVVYTDGAASKNGQRGARAGYGVFWGADDPRNEGGPLEGEKQTNQRGELTAVLRALEQSRTGQGSLEIRTDSQYTINCVESWSVKWLKNGWKGSSGKPVDNRDLVERILDLKKLRPGKVWLTYVAGHSGDYGNDNADRLAVEGARLGQLVKKV